MANDNNVELLIKAKDDATKTIEGVGKAIKDLRDQTQSTSEKMLKSDKTLKQLNESYSELNSTLSDLKSLQKLTNEFAKADRASTDAKESFSDASEQLKSQKSIVNDLTSEYDELESSLLDAKKDLDVLTSASKKDKNAIIEQKDAIRKLTAERAKSRAELKRQESSLNKISTAYKKASASNIKMASNLKEVSDKASKSGITLQNLSSKSKELSFAIRSTGESLLSAKSKIDGHTKALLANAKASSKASVATERTAKSTRLFGNESRKSMSVVQRVRGEILSITAAYVGLYGVVNQVTESFRSYNEQQGALAKLTSAYDGDMTLAAEEMEYVAGVADRLGLSVGVLEKSYSSFFVSAKLAGESASEIRTIFENMASAASVNKLTADNFNGAMTAMIQIMSKGTVMSEELQGQLAERFPGAVSLFAQSMEIGTKELRKMMEQGQLTSDMLLGFSIAVAESAESGLPIAMRSLLADFNRLDNAITELQRKFAELAEEDVGSALRDLTDVLRGEGGVKLVEALAVAFGAVVTAGRFVVENIDEITEAVKLLINLKLLSMVMDFAGGMRKLTKSTDGATKSFKKLAAQLGIVATVFTAINYALNNMEELYVGFKYYFDVAVAGYDTLKKTMSAPITAAVIDGSQMVADFKKSMDEIVAGIDAEYGSSVLVKARVQRPTYASEPALLKSNTTIDAENTARLEQEERDKRDAESKLVKKQRLDALNAKNAQIAADKIRKSLLDEYVKLETSYRKSSADSVAEQIVLVNDKYDGVIQRLTEIGEIDEANRLSEIKQYELTKIQEEEQVRRRKELSDLIEKEERQQKENRDQELAEIAKIDDLVQVGLAQRAVKIADVRRLKEQGSLESLQEALVLEESLKGVDKEALTLIDDLIAMYEAVGGSDADKAILKLEVIKGSFEGAGKAIINVDSQLKNFASGAASSLTELGKGLADAIRGTGSLGDAFDNAGEKFQEFASNFMINIGEMILQALILRAVQGIVGDINVPATKTVTTPTKHGGGLVGSASGQTTNRSVVPQSFIRYHTGGIAGLRPNEVPTVLERGEEVLTVNDPRHRYNGGGGGKVEIIDQRGIDSPDIEQQSGVGADGMETLKLIIRDSVKEDMNSGGFDTTMGQFGAIRKGIRR